MIILCDNTLEDIVAFNLFHSEHSPVVRRWNNLVRYGGAVLLALVLILGDIGFGFFPLTMGLGVVFIAAWVLLLPKIHRWMLKRMVRRFVSEGRNMSMIGGRTFRLEVDSMIETTDSTESRTRWDGVEQIVRNDDYIFVYNSAVTAYVVPKRAFESDGEFNSFFETATKLKAEFAG